MAGIGGGTGGGPGVDVDKAIRKAVASVRKRRILDRIIALIRHFKGERIEERRDHMRVKGETTLNIGGGSARFTEESYGQFHEYLRVKAYYGGSLMFEAVHGGHNAPADVDPRRVFRSRAGITRVETYRPGLWMDLLNLKRLIRKEAARKKREELERRRPVKPEPVRENDYDLAQRFAIRDMDRFLGK